MFRYLIPALFVVSVSCSSADASAKERTRAACHSLRGGDSLIKPGSTILIGELHGTAEVGRAAADLACEAAAKNIDVRIGLELAREFETAFKTYVRSAGTAKDRAALLAEKIWLGEFQDGRTSQATVELLDAIRLLRAQGHDADVFMMTDSDTSRDRSLGMAEAVAMVRAAAPNAVVLTIAGNNHTRVDEPQELGGILIAQGMRPVSLAVAYESGTSWGCQGVACGVYPAKGLDKQGTGRAIEIVDGLHVPGSTKAAWHGLLHVGPVTASPPAVVIKRSEQGSR